MSSTQRRPERRPALSGCAWAWVAGGVLIAACFVRVLGLGDASLTTDEGYTWNMIHSPWSSVLFTVADVHPPLYYSLQKLVLPLGDTEWMLRLPSAIFGAVGCGVAWLIGRRFGSPTIALVALVFVALSHGHIEHSQNARNYSLLFLELELCLATMLFALEQPERRRWLIAHGVCVTLVLYTHVIGAFYLAPMGLCALVLARSRAPGSRRWRRWVWAYGAVALLWLPWIARMPVRPHTFNWMSRLDPLAELSTGLALLVSDNFPLALLVWIIAIGGAASAIRRDGSALGWMCLMLLVAAPALMLLVGVVRPVLIARVLTPALAGLAFGVALALDGVQRRVGRVALWGLVALAWVAAGAQIVAVRAVTQVGQDWRSAFRHASGAGELDAVVLCPFWAMQATSYYMTRLELTESTYGRTIGYPPEPMDVLRLSLEKLRRQLRMQIGTFPPGDRHLPLTVTLADRERVAYVSWLSECVEDAGHHPLLEQMIADGFEVEPGGRLELNDLLVVRLRRAPTVHDLPPPPPVRRAQSRSLSPN